MFELRRNRKMLKMRRLWSSSILTPRARALTSRFLQDGLSQKLLSWLSGLMQNLLNPWKIAIIRKAKSWAITDARIVGRCSTPGMCNTQASAYVQNVGANWEQPKKKRNTGKQKNTGKRGKRKCGTVDCFFWHMNEECKGSCDQTFPSSFVDNLSIKSQNQLTIVE